jgi:hypothetical protein
MPYEIPEEELNNEEFNEDEYCGADMFPNDEDGSEEEDYLLGLMDD